MWGEVGREKEKEGRKSGEVYWKRECEPTEATEGICARVATLARVHDNACTCVGAGGRCVFLQKRGMGGNFLWTIFL